MVPRSAPKELKDEVYRLLRLFAEHDPDFHKDVYMGDPELTDRAMLYLRDLGFMEYRKSPGCVYARLTPRGYEQWEKINTGAVRYWFKHNKFVVITGAITLLFSGTAAVASVIGLF